MTHEARRVSALIAVLAAALFALGCHRNRESPAAVAPSPPPPAAPACNLSAEPSTVEKGQSVTLSWSSQNGTGMDLQPGVGKVQAQGSSSVKPDDSTTYTMTATGPGGTQTCTARVTVTVPPPPPPPPRLEPAADESHVNEWFPWPPPKWSLKYPISDALVTQGQTNMDDALERIKQALVRAGIDQWSVYPIKGGGFAVVGRMEQIYDDGRPKSPRYAIEDDRLSAFSLEGYLRALFSANPGRYRVIALLVTSLSVEAPGPPPGPEDMINMADTGPNTLPPAVAAQAITPRVKCEALIYEFYRPNPDVDPKPVVPSSLTAIQHLAGAGLWTTEELKR